MKPVLLVTPHCPGWPEWPVGMAYVLACLEQEGIPFEFLDLTCDAHWEATLRQRLKPGRYLAVASGGIIGFHRFFRRLAGLVHELAPGTSVVLGGNITKDADDALLFDSIGADHAIIGEAEMSFPGFLRKLADGAATFEGMPGVAYREPGGRVVRNAPVRLDMAVHKAYPAWRHFDWRFYVERSSFSFIGSDLRFMPVLSGRGCIGKCGFCSPTIGGFRKRPIEDVIGEIRHLSENYDFDTVCFLNEMFYPTAREVREFCAAYRESGCSKPWFVQVRIDAGLDVETLRMMKQAGCIAVTAGIESGSDKVLRLMNKKIHPDQIRTFFRNCREAGLPASGTYIVGYQDETEQDIKATIDLLIEEDINSGEALLFVYQGTEVYRQAILRGLITDEIAQLDAISGELFRPDVMRGFINLTAMPTPEFISVAGREVRRFNAHLFATNAVENLTRTVDSGARWSHCRLEGQCRHCGATLRHRFTLFGRSYLGFLSIGLNRTLICSGCRRPIAWDVSRARGLEHQLAHSRQLAEKLATHDRIVLCGTNNDLDFTLRLGLPGLDFSKVVGVLSFEPTEWGAFLTYPVVGPEGLAGLRPDCLLVLDPFQDTGALLAKIRAAGLPEPTVLSLAGPELVKQLWREASLTARVFRGLFRVLGTRALDLLNVARRVFRQ